MLGEKINDEGRGRSIEQLKARWQRNIYTKMDTVLIATAVFLYVFVVFAAFEILIYCLTFKQPICMIPLFVMDSVYSTCVFCGSRYIHL